MAFEKTRRVYNPRIRERQSAQRNMPRKYTIKKGRWSSDEDDRLLTLVKLQKRKHDEIIWDEVEDGFKTRSKKQCRERWLSQLDPNLKKSDWTAEEDKLLLDLSTQLKKKWAEIARRIPGRTENMVKNRWHALDRMSSSTSANSKRKRTKSSSVNTMTISNSRYNQVKEGPPSTTAHRSLIPTANNQQEAADEVYPLSCISNTEASRATEYAAPVKPELVFTKSAESLARLPSFDDKLFTREFGSQPFCDKPDVIQRHPSFDTNKLDMYDRLPSTNSLRSSGRQTSYDLISQLNNSFDTKKPSGLERQQSLGVSQLSSSLIDELFLQEQYDGAEAWI